MAAGTQPEIATVVERRRSPRAPLTVRVEYGTVDAFFSDFSRNLNEGGIFVETDQPLDLEERVVLKFRLPGESKPVEVTGRVVRISTGAAGEPRGMAVEFDALAPENRLRIDELVRALRVGRG